MIFIKVPIIKDSENQGKSKAKSPPIVGVITSKSPPHVKVITSNSEKQSPIQGVATITVRKIIFGIF